MKSAAYKRQKSLYLNRRELIRASVSTAGLMLFGSLPACAKKKAQDDPPPTVYGSMTSANPGDELSLWTASISLNGMVPMTAEGNRTATLKYSNSNGKFKVPVTASGIYMIEGQRPLVVKDPTMQAPIVVVFPYNTVAAYNHYGDAHNFYAGPDGKFESRSRKISFTKPTNENLAFTQGFETWHGSLPDSKRSLFRFISDQDMDDYSQIADAKVLVIIGHSEYWTRQARANFDAFVDAGGNAAVLSGNTMYWQVRYTDDASGLICYKKADEDQVSDPSMTTIEWNSEILNYKTPSSIGVIFENGGFGNFADNGWDGYKIVNPNSPLLAGTGLRKGDVIHFSTHEYDGAPIKGFDASGAPILDEAALGFYRTELVGYDFGQFRGKKTVPTFFAFQKTQTSGIVVNTASTNWCCFNGMGDQGINGSRMRKITENIIFGMLEGKPIFST